MMVYDIEYWRESSQLKRRKTYMPLGSIYEPPMWDDIPWNPKNIKKNVDKRLQEKEAEEFERKRQIAKAKLKELS